MPCSLHLSFPRDQYIFGAMLSTRNEILAHIQSPAFMSHPHFSGMETFACLPKWAQSGPVVVELPRVKIEIHGIDYIRNLSMSASSDTGALKFQQNRYRLWYQVDGHGILHNATRNSFGAARPGLLGVMELGERHSYLHQKGPFECFLMEFSLLPSQQAKCYWNSEVEGKRVLENDDRLYFENLVFDLVRVIANGKEILGLASISRILEILVVLFSKGLLIVNESQFPENKPKSLVEKAKHYMRVQYATMRGQNGLAKECGVDINYLNILFTRETGKTLYQFLTDVRMEHAKYLLEEKKLPVVTIASLVGYPNANSFSRAFRRFLKQTPTLYREGQNPQPRPATHT
jgi:AraC-like DNA-binding protein